MSKVSIFFFPHIGGGHLLPMIDTARFIASHPNVSATIVTTPLTIQLFQTAIDRDREAGHDISFHAMDLPKAQFGLPDHVENHLNSLSGELRYKVFMAILSLKEPLLELLRDRRPDCLVSDVVQSWTLDVANKAGIPRVAFRVANVFALCVDDSLKKFKPHERVGSDDEAFVVPGLPDLISMTRKRIPFCQSDQNVVSFFDEMHRAEKDSYGVIVNSFDGLEHDYIDYAKTVMGMKLWAVGPVSNFNKTAKDKSERGRGKTVQDEEIIVKWLNSKAENSVVYVSFGGEAAFCKEQFHEIAHGLEGSGHPFIWVARPNNLQDQSEDGWFPEGFEERMRDSNQGLVIKGWAPQLLILEHVNVGAFLTHCGWNSAIEGLSIGVPMITWPLGVEMFYNEALLVDVLKVGDRVGAEECVYMSMNPRSPKVTVLRDKIEAAVKRMLGNNEEVVEIRKRSQDLAEKSKKALEEGGSSYHDVYALVDELQARKNVVIPMND